MCSVVSSFCCPRAASVMRQVMFVLIFHRLPIGAARIWNYVMEYTLCVISIIMLSSCYHPGFRGLSTHFLGCLRTLKVSIFVSWQHHISLARQGLNGCIKDGCRGACYSNRDYSNITLVNCRCPEHYLYPGSACVAGIIPY